MYQFTFSLSFSRRSVSGRNQPPVMVPHRKVSFADIVQAQELEQEDQRKYGREVEGG